jgi:acetate kinase
MPEVDMPSVLTTSDTRTLRSNAPADDNARAATDLFVYRIQREIGSLAAALGGIDALAFTGGIGENDVATRAEVLSGSAGSASASTRRRTARAGRGSPPALPLFGSSPRTRNS